MLSRATSSPGLPDHQVAIITSSMVHLGVQVDLDLLQQLLFRTPRHNMSAGVMADLTAALRKLEQVDASTWQQLLDRQQARQEQQQRLPAKKLPKWRQRQQRKEQEQRQQQERLQNAADKDGAGVMQPVDGSSNQGIAITQADAAAGSTGGVSVNAGDVDDVVVDIDALIDTARMQLGASGLQDSRQQPLQQVVGEAAAGADAVSASAASASGSDAAEEVIDEATGRRIANRLAIVQELVLDSS